MASSEHRETKPPSESSGSVENAPTRHYPLDLPSLPFCRYEHRTLTARDIMIHRIMAEYMNPSRVKPHTYDSYIAFPNDFDPVKAQCRQLGLDLQVLRRTLYTSHSRDAPSPNSPLIASIPKRVHAASKPLKRPVEVRTDRAVKGPRNKPPTLGDLILDLVMRHYLETEDPALRTWISRARPPQITRNASVAARPVQQTGRKGFARTTRKGQFEAFNELLGIQARVNQKVWRKEDAAHLASLRSQVAIQDQLSLYDGGSFLPQLVQTRDAGGIGPRGARGGVNVVHWSISEVRSGLESIPVWPEDDTGLRFILQQSWDSRREPQHVLKNDVVHRLDISLNQGRGRNHDGIWATGRASSTRMGRPDADGVHRGRRARIRKRSTSEPPPGSFAVASLPLPNLSTSTTHLQLFFPRMTLAVLDAKSRRRSLSRTRIGEMFDWDVSLHDRGHDTPTETAPNPKERRGSSGRTPAGPNWPSGSSSWIYTHSSQATDVRGHGRGQSVTNTRGGSPLGKQCQNCLDRGHCTSDCPAPCGHCGAPNPAAYNSDPANPIKTRHRRGVPPAPPPRVTALTLDMWRLEADPRPAPFDHQPSHLAPQCPVARHNRCKCVPFPTFHTAARCSVPCRRDCGNPEKKGSFKHRSAMTCRGRCCMCGIRGHSGKDCRQTKCRCGGAHLGQDCSWRPACVAKGCGRYWCGVHCRDCGAREKPLVGWRCWKCLGRAEPFSRNEHGRRGRRRRRREAGESEKQAREAGRGERAGTLFSGHGNDDYDDYDDITTILAAAGPKPELASIKAEPSSIFGDPRERQRRKHA